MPRGLQGSYNALAAKYGFTIPYGAVWLFSIACSQIMYGFLLRPDTLPRTYISWIDQAGQIPVKGVAMNRDLVREGSFKISDIDDLISNPVRSSRLATIHTSVLTLHWVRNFIRKTEPSSWPAEQWRQDLLRTTVIPMQAVPPFIRNGFLAVLML